MVAHSLVGKESGRGVTWKDFIVQSGNDAQDSCEK